MKILHVVPLISSDGAFGGPVRVAENQVIELISRGHDVALLGGRYRSDEGLSPSTFPRRLYSAFRILPKGGFAGLWSPGLIAAVGRSSAAADIVHIHMARDLTTLPAALVAELSGTPVIIQPHGMIMPSKKKIALILDFFLTKRVLRKSSRILTLTQEETDGLLAMTEGNVFPELTTNGISFPERPTDPGGDKPLEVLFLARLHKRKRPRVFVEMARRLVEAGSSAHFSIVGPDEGEAPGVNKLIEQYGLGHRITVEGPLDPSLTAARMATCSIYVLPSVGEIIPMSVLEAMSLGLPVVITESNGLAAPLKEGKAAYVVNESVDDLVSAVQKLLDNANLRRELGARARALAETNYSIRSVVNRLEQTYSAVLRENGAHGG